MAKLIDLIEKCKEEEIFTQNLDDNISGMNIKGENGYIEFLTKSDFVKERILGKPNQVGVVVWLPADVFER